MQLHPESILKFLRAAKHQNLSMRRRLAVYLILLCCAVALLSFFVLNLLGLVSPIDRQLESALVHQLDSTTGHILHDADDTAAWGLSLSESISAAVGDVLREHQMTFEDLRNNEAVLSEIQSSLYGDVYTHMRLATCSGAFYMLNSTVNDALPEKSYNGLYLKYANLYAENTIHNRACMFRGSYAVARENDISLYSTWRLETLAETFPQAVALMDGHAKYLLTQVCSLPDSWERVRLLCAPVYLDGEVIGVCGFELSDLYFQLAYPADSGEEDHLLCALLTNSSGAWTGQISGHLSAVSTPMQKTFSIKNRGRFVQFNCTEGQFIGLTHEIAVGDSKHLVAAMLPMNYYERIVRQSQLNLAGVLLLLTLLFFAACIYLSHRYVSPILQGLSELKTKENDHRPTHIPEIDDLFAYLSAKDRQHEEEISRLQSENAGVQRERERAESALSNLQAAGMQEIDPEVYALFCNNLCSLTPKEHEIFDLYLGGKTGKEIQEILCINPNTIKYHNRNIYDKLGVCSRKELLKYATLMTKEKDDHP